VVWQKNHAPIHPLLELIALALLELIALAAPAAKWLPVGRKKTLQIKRLCLFSRNGGEPSGATVQTVRISFSFAASN
jgi:hypothetical protein